MQSSPGLKKALIAVNVVIIVYSIVVISVQSASLVRLRDLSAEPGVVGVPAFCISVACIALLVAAVGLGTAAKDSYCLGITFCVVLSMLLMLEVLLGTAYFVVFHLRLNERVESSLLESMASYTSSQSDALWWDQLQTQFECCGSKSAADWLPVLETTDYLPMTCCARVTGQVGKSSCTMAAINRFKYACAPQVNSSLQQNATASGFTLLGLALIQVACIIIAGLFTHPLKSMW